MPPICYDKTMKPNFNLSAFFRDLFMVETECTLSFALIGSIFARSAAISYAHFFIPLALGVVCMIPCLPVYLKENMTIPQVIAQRAAELIVLEIVCIWVGDFLAGDFLGKIGLVAVAVSTAFFDVLSYVIMYKMELAEAARLNKKLREIAEKALEQTAGGSAKPAHDETPKAGEAAGKIEAFGDRDSRVLLPLGDILYFEADAEQVFAYMSDEIYQVKLRLYQVEELARTAGIIRASKSHLLNVRKIHSVRPALNSRLYAKMPNGEEVLVTRKYAPALKAAME